MCLYLSLSALHVSDCSVHHQDRRFGAVYRNWYKPVRLAVVLYGYNCPTATRTGLYQLQYTAPKRRS